MTTIRKGLESPFELSKYEAEIAVSYGLLNKDRTVTELGRKLLLKDEEAFKEVKLRVGAFWSKVKHEPDWVTKPVYKKYPRVFGHGYK